MSAAPTPEQQRLIDGYRRFRAGKYAEAAQLYEDLGDHQDPDIMIIGCADSRADPALIFDGAPGEFFVVRNVAALVPPCADENSGYHGVSAAVEFAVTALKVKHILVLGHGNCGGMKAALAAADDKPIGRFIAPWVELVDPERKKVLEDPAIVSPEAKQQAMEYGGVEQSLTNLMTFPFVKDAVERGELALEGAWFSIGEGKLRFRDSQTRDFVDVDPVA